MPADPIHIGDKGTTIIITFKNLDVSGTAQILDISSAALIQITFINPAGVLIGPFTMSKLTDGIDGKAFYVTNRTFSLWDQIGTWFWFGRVAYTDSLFTSDRASRSVII